MLSNAIHILLVEDNPGDVFIIRKLLLQNFGSPLTLTAVERLSEAIRCLDNAHVDLCLLDLSLPDSQGLHSLLTLQQKNTTLPIVMLTSLDNEALATQAVRLGAQDYLVKDQINKIWLKRAIHHAIERAHLLAKLREHELELQQMNQQLQVRIAQRTTTINTMQKHVEELQSLALTDPLTQVVNRLGFDQWLKQEWFRSVGNGTPLSLIMVDLDYFKQFNDTYGHQGGDLCLKQVAQAIKEQVQRPRDLVTRYGGEEFAIILPDTSEMGAVQVAERALASVRALEIVHAASPIAARLTMSLGIAAAMPQADELPQDLIRKADHALYQAKHQGRDRVSCYKPYFS